MGNCKPRVSCIRISAVNRREPTGAERLNQGLTALCSHIYARGQCPVLLLPESLEMVPSANRRNSQVTAFRPMGLSGWQSSKNEGCELRVPSSAMTELNSVPRPCRRDTAGHLGCERASPRTCSYSELLVFLLPCPLTEPPGETAPE